MFRGLLSHSSGLVLTIMIMVACVGSRTPQGFGGYSLVRVMCIRWEMYFLPIEGTELVRK